jgi:hypothetical protein
VRVRDASLDEREVGADPVLEDILASADRAELRAVGERRAHGGRRVERGNPSATRADPLGERALGDELELDLAAVVELGEHRRVRGARERAHDLRHAAGLQQRGQSDLSASGVVADDREAPCALVDERMDELDRTSGLAEAADHHRGAIMDVGHGLADACDALVDHRQAGAGAPWVMRALFTRE